MKIVQVSMKCMLKFAIYFNIFFLKFSLLTLEIFCLNFIKYFFFLLNCLLQHTHYTIQLFIMVQLYSLLYVKALFNIDFVYSKECYCIQPIAFRVLSRDIHRIEVTPPILYKHICFYAGKRDLKDGSFWIIISEIFNLYNHQAVGKEIIFLYDIVYSGKKPQTKSTHS